MVRSSGSSCHKCHCHLASASLPSPFDVQPALPEGLEASVSGLVEWAELAEPQRDEAHAYLKQRADDLAPLNSAMPSSYFRAAASTASL